MSTTHSAHRIFSFGEFTLDVERGALLKDGVDVKLRPKSFEVLRLLVERHGRLVSKDELLDAVWGRAIVTEGSVTQCLIDVRRALGDDSQQTIRTVPRRGYIFDVPVSESDDASSTSVDAHTSAADLRTFVSRHAVWAALMLLSVISVGWWILAARDDSAPTAVRSVQAPPNSIAVLPFVDMSPDHDQEYLSDGIAEETLNLLAKTPGLHVIARTSSFSFKNQNVDIATIAAKLNVAHVLEGSVRKSGNRVRITAQLVETAGSSHLWSETYERELQDAFAVQKEIATAVARALKVTLARNPDAVLPAPANARAYEQFLQGRFFYNRRAPGDVQRSLEHFQEALRSDPTYARAWAALAGVYGAQISDGTAPAELALPKRREAVERALALDPDLAAGHIRAAQHYWETGNVTAAREHYRQALALEPDDPLVLTHSANIEAWQGRLNEAVEFVRRAVALDPVAATLRGNLGGYLLAAGRYEEAEAEFRKERELNPAADADVALGFTYILQRRFDEALATAQRWPEGEDRDQALALIYHAIGRTAQADTALQKLIASPALSASVRVSEVYAYRGDFDEAFKWLDEAHRRIDPDIRLSPQWRSEWQLRFSPFLRVLHADPRWDSWLRHVWPAATETTDTPVIPR